MASSQALSSLFIETVGGQLQDTLDVNTNNIINLANPVNSTDACNSLYVGLSSIREIEYNYIASLGPVFWLSSYYYDGIRPKSSQPVVTLTGITKDTVGNSVTQTGTINIQADSSNGNRSAYYFNGSNNIISTNSVSTAFTFFFIYRRDNPTSTNGGLFTGNGGTGTRVFGSWNAARTIWYSDAWLTAQTVNATSNIEFVIATNNNNTKNMWDKSLSTSVVTNSTVGANDWGTITIGKPSPSSPYVNAAGTCYMYETIVFNSVLTNIQIQRIIAILRRYCNI